MKIRGGFVSNSSSASFIVAFRGPVDDNLLKEKLAQCVSDKLLDAFKSLLEEELSGRLEGAAGIIVQALFSSEATARAAVVELAFAEIKQQMYVLTASEWWYGREAPMAVAAEHAKNAGLDIFQGSIESFGDGGNAIQDMLACHLLADIREDDFVFYKDNRW